MLYPLSYEGGGWRGLWRVMGAGLGFWGFLGGLGVRAGVVGVRLAPLAGCWRCWGVSGRGLAPGGRFGAGAGGF